MLPIPPRELQDSSRVILKSVTSFFGNSNEFVQRIQLIRLVLEKFELIRGFYLLLHGGHARFFKRPFYVQFLFRHRLMHGVKKFGFIYAENCELERYPNPFLATY